MAGLLVTSPFVWKTTTLGGRTPTPKACSVRWLASYAGLPRIGKLWYQRLDSWPAANPPINVRTTQVEITHHLRRAITWARRPSFPVSTGWTAASMSVLLLKPQRVSQASLFLNDLEGVRNSSAPR